MIHGAPPVETGEHDHNNNHDENQRNGRLAAIPPRGDCTARPLVLAPRRLHEGVHPGGHAAVKIARAKTRRYFIVDDPLGD